MGPWQRGQGQVVGWLKDDAALLTVLEGIKRAARDWAANGKATSWLAHSEARLRAAERLLARPDLAAQARLSLHGQFADAVEPHRHRPFRRILQE